MVIELMLISGVGFSVVCGISLSGAVDKGAEALQMQEKGEYEKWNSKNEFQVKDLVDVPDFIEDVKDETQWIYDWKRDQAGAEGGCEDKKES